MNCFLCLQDSSLQFTIEQPQNWLRVGTYMYMYLISFKKATFFKICGWAKSNNNNNNNNKWTNDRLDHKTKQSQAM